jgi:hypothetical protein
MYNNARQTHENQNLGLPPKPAFFFKKKKQKTTLTLILKFLRRFFQKATGCGQSPRF